MTDFIEPAPHEFAANFLFDEDGLAPFFAADRQIKAGGGSHGHGNTDTFYPRPDVQERPLWFWIDAAALLNPSGSDS